MVQSFTMSEAEEVIVRALEIEPDKRGSASALVKYFRRLGLPKTPKRGRGRSTHLQITHVFELLVAFRLTQVCLPPKFAILGAVKAGEFFRRDPAGCANPYLAFSGKEIELVASGVVQRRIEAGGSGTFVAIQPLIMAFALALPESVSPARTDEDSIHILDYIWEVRDGAKRH